MHIVPLQFNFDNSEPLYLQLFHYLKELILTEQLTFGTKLPPIRTFAKELGVNNSTVISAYKQLEVSGYIVSKQGSGFYVSKEINQPSSLLSSTFEETNITKINFASASPHPGIFPTETFKEYLVEVIDRDKGFAFGYQEINGFGPLREVLCALLKETYHINTDKSRIQIVSGAQQGIDIIAKSCLHSGDSVITEKPTYNGALEVFKLRGCRIVSVGLNSKGIDLIELEKKVKICRPKMLYVMPNYQNPTTLCYSKNTLIELLYLAEKYNFFIIEEDSMSELTYTAADVLSLKSLDTYDRVIYLKSFSKLLMPGLRMGFIIMPEVLAKDLTKTKQTTDISSSGLIQRALELYIKNGKWHEHIHYMKEIYRGKYEYMLSKLEKLKIYGIEFNKPEGGLCFWLHLSNLISARSLSELASSSGLMILPSTSFYSHLDRFKDSYIRLSFAACSIDDIQKGMDILEMCLESYFQMNKI